MRATCPAKDLDIVRVLANQPSGARLQQIFGTPFADACDAGVGFNRDDHVTSDWEAGWDSEAAKREPW